MMFLTREFNILVFKFFPLVLILLLEHKDNFYLFLSNCVCILLNFHKFNLFYAQLFSNYLEIYIHNKIALKSCLLFSVLLLFNFNESQLCICQEYSVNKCYKIINQNKYFKLIKISQYFINVFIYYLLLKANNFQHKNHF